MSHRVDDKRARREARLEAEATAARRERRRTRAFWALAAAAVAGLLTAAFLVPRQATTTAMSVESGASAAAVARGDRAPDFRLTDVVTGTSLSLADLRGRKTLLFFSEGASCQACLVQASELQKAQALKRAGVGLVSISTDPPDVLRDVAKQYAISTPLLADDTQAMSRAYGQLGRGGMGHADRDGHSFVLLDGQGRVAWERAYEEMYVPTQRLIGDMGI